MKGRAKRRLELLIWEALGSAGYERSLVYVYLLNS